MLLISQKQYKLTKSWLSSVGLHPNSMDSQLSVWKNKKIRLRYKKNRKGARLLRKMLRERKPITMTLSYVLKIRPRFFTRHGYRPDMSGETDCMIPKEPKE